MSLNNQIELLLVSFLYGIFVFITLELNSKFIYNLRKLYRYPITILFTLNHSLLYFLVLLKLNYGYIHMYGIFMTILSFLGVNILYNYIVNHYKRWYTYYDRMVSYESEKGF